MADPVFDKYRYFDKHTKIITQKRVHKWQVKLDSVYESKVLEILIPYLSYHQMDFHKEIIVFGGNKIFDQKVYYCDFVIDNMLFIETKGYWTHDYITKLLLLSLTNFDFTKYLIVTPDKCKGKKMLPRSLHPTLYSLSEFEIYCSKHLYKEI